MARAQHSSLQLQRLTSWLATTPGGGILGTPTSIIPSWRAGCTTGLSNGAGDCPAAATASETLRATPLPAAGLCRPLTSAASPPSGAEEAAQPWQFARQQHRDSVVAHGFDGAPIHTGPWLPQGRLRLSNAVASRPDLLQSRGRGHLHRHLMAVLVTASARAAAPPSPRTLCTSSVACSAPDPPSPHPQQDQTPEPRPRQQRQPSNSTPSAGSAPVRTPAPVADLVYNLPNAVSVARLVSGPVIGLWLVQGHYEAATLALAISGASDWLDGYLARRMGASSVFGSYLDPLADKVLIGCVAAALLANGTMPVWLAAVVVGRDLLLVTGAFVFRFRGFGWRWPGREAFFRTVDTSGGGSGGSSGEDSKRAAEAGNGGGASSAGEGVAFMRPLLISKANTVLQLVLLGGYLMQGMQGWPGGDAVTALELATAATTVVSGAAYGAMAVRGNLFK